jgi:hypothetical protein
LHAVPRVFEAYALQLGGAQSTLHPSEGKKLLYTRANAFLKINKKGGKEKAKQVLV